MIISKIRTYMYDYDGQNASYSCHSKKGSYNNYVALREQLERRYGKFNNIKTYEDYKKILNRIYIYK